jgi:hypothetical protein
MGSTLIAIVVLGFVGGPNVEAGPDVSVARTIQLMTTNRHIIRSTDYRQVLPTNVGGGLGRLGEDILLVTGEGAFWRIRLAGDSIADLEPLNLRAPFNREEFVANADPEIPRDNFRISGLLVQPVGDRSRIVISHNHWNADEECFTVRFSETILGDVELRPEVASNGADAPSWRTLHETRPCLPFRGRRFAGIESGGRIAPLGDTAIIVTVGDYEFDGVNDERALAQSADNDYGKTLIIPLDGGPVRVFTLGHRNPMGLLVAPGGEIWATENGPEGGDELNLLAEGANYGWPLQTFGTQYNELTWPLEDESSPHPEFTLPVFSWVPSISVTNLITLERGGFPRWGDDLLVASLRERSLYRLHREGGRIVYSEPIPVQRRIRDLVETVDGRLVLWADGGSLVILSSADDELGLSPRDEGIEYTP